ncbi:unnamed protein product [Lota lota]
MGPNSAPEVQAGHYTKNNPLRVRPQARLGTMMRADAMHPGTAGAVVMVGSYRKSRDVTGPLGVQPCDIMSHSNGLFRFPQQDLYAFLPFVPTNPENTAAAPRLNKQLGVGIITRSAAPRDSSSPSASARGAIDSAEYTEPSATHGGALIDNSPPPTSAFGVGRVLLKPSTGERGSPETQKESWTLHANDPNPLTELDWGTGETQNPRLVRPGVAFGSNGDVCHGGERAGPG